MTLTLVCCAGLCRDVVSIVMTLTLVCCAGLCRDVVNIVMTLTLVCCAGLCRDVVNIVMTLTLVYLSLPVVVNLLTSRQQMNASFGPLKVLNTYGAFGR